MKITICGAGWLGLPLAQQLNKRGHTIVATKRSEQGVNELTGLGLLGMKMSLGEAVSEQDKPAMFNSDWLIINIPPGRKAFDPETFIQGMFDLIDQAKFHQTSAVLFVSTSAVYGDHAGRVIETTPVQPVTASAKAHLDIEGYIREKFPDQHCILRLSGLTGSSRHPAKHLAGRTGLANGEHKVNLVHLVDVISAIELIVAGKGIGQTLHLCASEHPSRKSYYTWAATRMGLQPPTFSDVQGPAGKWIDATATLDTLGLKLRYPSPFDMQPETDTKKPG